MSSSTTSPPSTLCSHGSPTTEIADDVLRRRIYAALERLGPRDDVLLLPPDFTRFHSRAGTITRMICEYYNFIPTTTTSSDTPPTSSSSPDVRILPALGTHAPMTDAELRIMFGDALTTKEDPNKPFVVHDWRRDVVTIGRVPAEMVSDATYGRVKDRPWPAQVNRLIWEKRRRRKTHRDDDDDEASSSSPKPAPLVLSIGQVVPHEGEIPTRDILAMSTNNTAITHGSSSRLFVSSSFFLPSFQVMGMANFNKNVFVGTGGVEAINLSHFIGAVHGMEKMMGRAHNPLRDILNYASERFLQDELDLWYFLTVVGPSDDDEGGLALRGLYVGRDIECYNHACDLSLQVNFTLLDEPLRKCVVRLGEDEFHSTWLGNKAIYRTRMAMADGGTLIILAPGVERFGEDAQVDRLIRRYGYKGTPTILRHMNESEELRDNLSAVAHLMHGSTEGRFRVVYCPGHLTQQEIEQAGFEYGDLAGMMEIYDPAKLRDGWNTVNGEEIFYISNPALGLWAVPSRFEGKDE